LSPSKEPVPEEDVQLHNNITLKALFRSFKALMSLDQLDEAKDALQRYRSMGGLADPAVLKMEKTLDERLLYRDKMRSESAERERRQKLSDQALFQAIKVNQNFFVFQRVLVLLLTMPI
jgi:hypothetical protein